MSAIPADTHAPPEQGLFERLVFGEHLSAEVRRSLRRSLTLLALAPITVLLATWTVHLVDDPILGIYGMTLLCVKCVGVGNP